MISQHFLTDKGYGGKCVPSLSPVISEDQLVPEGETVLVGANGVIRVVKQGIKFEGFSDVESPDFAFGKKPDGKGGWVRPLAPPTTDASQLQALFNEAAALK